ncbi:MAG: 4-aminobutyrate--2-oxoglutarate transaminase [Gemmatimonadaceae bacterium]
MNQNDHLQRRHAAAIPRGVASATAVYAARAENAEIWDVDGKRYIDFAAGIAVLNTGHRHPKVLAAVRAQLDAYTHTAFQVLPYEPYVALAERLNALAPFEETAKTILFTTGAEAVENAVKIARAATGRSAVIAFSGAFHGRTMLTMAMTGKVTPYKRAFGPLPSEIFHVPFPAPQYGVSIEDSLRALDFLFRADVEASRVAAIVIEPEQGEGGFHVAPAELLRALRTLCDANGILLIVDEVQSGMARTGRMFAIEHSGVEPDLITVAKSLAGGFPLSAVVGRARIMDAVEPGGLGGTFAGSPIACAAALAVLDVIDEERLTERATSMGDRIRCRLQSFEARSELRPIAFVRGLGAMLAFDVVQSRARTEPDGPAAKAVAVRALELGLVVLTCGVFGETIRLLPPLTASDALVDEGLDILGLALLTNG